ncbi:hypothetical protein Mucpa_3081 [Mucilaginibacter paludis DSM 18603]|uniref:Uncharacterized protein n=1 Tax=Mucilaginibacter paludis DSM 18603 TaxID=714943 RepID=H1YEF1_9SPHI|nr:hypothetical protein Mucpa_3081 [Mucilaginibacter paludis DSM 18603]
MPTIIVGNQDMNGLHPQFAHDRSKGSTAISKHACPNDKYAYSYQNKKYSNNVSFLQDSIYCLSLESFVLI